VGDGGQEAGATIIHVDPRFTRTSAVSDIFVPLRAGSDIAFLGGLLNYVLSNELDFREYVVAYTNAAAIISEEFRDTEDLDGLFSGYDPETGHYDTTSWQYQNDEESGDSAARPRRRMRSTGRTQPGRWAAVGAKPPRDETLQHPRCVYQVLKRHYARYTPAMVAEVCGVSEEKFLAVAEALTRNSGRERTTALCYAVGWTQHSTGVQMIRAAAILQLLLGNMGRPGGGIMALRGHASIQGCSDIPTLFNLLPGYLPMPHAAQHTDLTPTSRGRGVGRLLGQQARLHGEPAQGLLGDAATADNDFAFDYLPRIDGDHGHYQTVLDQIDGLCKGYFLVGRTPRWAPPTGACSASGWPTSSGWSCATW
jgi:formate dehydrogenase major subunit